MLVVDGVVGFVFLLQCEVQELQKHILLLCIVAIKYHKYIGKKARLDVHRGVLRREVRWRWNGIALRVVPSHVASPGLAAAPLLSCRSSATHWLCTCASRGNGHHSRPALSLVVRGERQTTRRSAARGLSRRSLPAGRNVHF